MGIKLISHRGNIFCNSHKDENNIHYIQHAIDLGYDVEIDIRLIDDILYLGHDTPDYEISLNWLLERSNVLWIHTKNFQALNYLIDYNLKVFFHEKESHTIINNCNLIWSHNLIEANNKSIIPLLSLEEISNFDLNNKKIFGVCSDFIGKLNERIV